MLRRLIYVALISGLWVSPTFAAPIHDAAEAGHVERIKALIKAGANVNVYQKGLGLTPLHLAALGGHTVVIKTLLNAGADANSTASTNVGATPLLFAAGNVDATAVKVLLGAGAEANPVASGIPTPLHYAVRWGHVAAVKAFNGMSPLHFSAFKGSVVAVKTLLDAGADADARTTIGMTPLKAVQIGMDETEERIEPFQEVIELLIASGARE